MEFAVYLTVLLGFFSSWMSTTQACGYVYIIVPKSSPSPDCDPVGQRFYLMCGGYVSTSMDIEWYWSPDLVTPGVEVTWLTTTSINGGTVSSGPYTGYLIIYNNLDSFNDFGAGHVGYYWCRYKDTGGSQAFIDSPKMLLDSTPSTGCANSVINYIDTVDICAEAVVVTSAVEVVPSSTITAQEETQLLVSPSSTPTVPTKNSGGFCCVGALYAGMAACVVTASTVFVTGGLIFIFAKILKRNAAWRLRHRVPVDRDPFAPRNNEEHSIGLVKCKKCIRTQQEKRVRFYKTVAQ